MTSGKWFFTKDQLVNSPSRKFGIDQNRELSYRQQSASLNHDIGQILRVSQLCINTAVVYMHRFYMFHPVTRFQRYGVACSAFLLATKVEDQPRTIKDIINACKVCFKQKNVPFEFLEKCEVNPESIRLNEGVIMGTFGFDFTIEHPHIHISKFFDLMKPNRDISRSSHFLATEIIHLTTMCLEYRSSVIACLCIYIACKWTDWEIPISIDGKYWFWYIDPSVTIELLNELTNIFLDIFHKSPSRFKRMVMSMKRRQESINVVASETESDIGTNKTLIVDGLLKPINGSKPLNSSDGLTNASGTLSMSSEQHRHRKQSPGLPVMSSNGTMDRIELKNGEGIKILPNNYNLQHLDLKQIQKPIESTATIDLSLSLVVYSSEICDNNNNDRKRMRDFEYSSNQVSKKTAI
ncbi:cyclin-T1-like [Microplitis mediator]|uniref:cyclin-T1-like n=1 Tax=Microplitis mediator TaxID=375433 RepID=UPI002555AC88|nr:cyclin-T1-like [Microplitis mediator]